MEGGREIVNGVARQVSCAVFAFLRSQTPPVSQAVNHPLPTRGSLQFHEGINLINLFPRPQFQIWALIQVSLPSH
jgi:hypothetical protein